jgi:hypothetical protein
MACHFHDDRTLIFLDSTPKIDNSLALVHDLQNKDCDQVNDAIRRRTQAPQRRIYNWRQAWLPTTC